MTYDDSPVDAEASATEVAAEAIPTTVISAPSYWVRRRKATAAG